MFRQSKPSSGQHLVPVLAAKRPINRITSYIELEMAFAAADVPPKVLGMGGGTRGFLSAATLACRQTHIRSGLRDQLTPDRSNSTLKRAALTAAGPLQRPKDVWAESNPQDPAGSASVPGQTQAFPARLAVRTWAHLPSASKGSARTKSQMTQDALMTCVVFWTREHSGWAGRCTIVKDARKGGWSPV